MKVKAGDFASIRIAYRMSAIMILCSVTQRDHWVGFGGPERRDVTGQERYADERERYSHERHRIERTDIEEHRAQRAAAHDSQDESGSRADENQLRGPADD